MQIIFIYIYIVRGENRRDCDSLEEQRGSHTSRALLKQAVWQLGPDNMTWLFLVLMNQDGAGQT